MENADYTFWLGLALAIPLAVVANIFTPKIQQWLASFSQSRAQKRIAYLSSVLEEYKELGSSPEKHHTFLLESILLITLLTSFFAVISGLLFAFSSFHSERVIVFFMAQLVSALGAATICKECFSTIIKSKRAKQISKYQEEIEKELEELGRKI